MNMPFRLTGLTLLGALLAATWGQTAEEYQVKAAFLYNFAKFVEWPTQAFKGSNDPITVCVLGQNPFGNALELAISGKSVAGRPFVVREIASANQAAGCHILFVSSSERKRFRSILGDLKIGGMLTVGEAQGFTADGGVINFKLEGGRIRFEINLDAAQQEQLRVSSKLLSLADVVRSEKN
jgi:hypothetical protein